MFCSINVHFQCLSGWTNSETDWTKKAGTRDMLCLDVILHDGLVLGLVLALVTTIHAATVSVH